MIVHLNGELLPLERARISPLDRGFVFGDGVYEGLRSVPDGDGGARLIGLTAHARRLQAGLDMAGIAFDASTIGPASLALLKANNLREAFIYWQITRGAPGPGDPPRLRVPPRNGEPGEGRLRPTVFGYCAPQPALESFDGPPTKRVVTCRDIRWELGRLKSISLMGNVVMAMDADRRGGEEAILIRGGCGSGPDMENGLVSEGLATNIILAVNAPGGGVELATPALGSVSILAGVTRDILLRAVPEIHERTVRASELLTAREVMLIGTTTLVTAVTHVDGRPVGDGSVGPEARRLFRVLVAAIRERRDEW